MNILEFILGTGRAYKLRALSLIRDLMDALIDATLAPVWDCLVQIFYELDPRQTTKLDQWERQFNIQFPGDDTARRDRLAAAWIAPETATADYIQSVLRAAGFDVYVYPAVESGILKNPFDWLEQDYVNATFTECGNVPEAECGNTPEAEAGNLDDPEKGYARANIFLLGDDTPVLPPDSDDWYSFVYIGGAPFGDFASIPLERRTEFEITCRKIVPIGDWLGLLVQYN